MGEIGHPPRGAGPNRSDNGHHRRSQRCATGDLHRPLQRSGARRGLPQARGCRLRLGQAGTQQSDRGRRRNPGSLFAPVEPTRSLRPGAGVTAFVLARAVPRTGRRRRALHHLATTPRGARRHAHGRQCLRHATRGVGSRRRRSGWTGNGQLPEEERHAIELAYFAGRTYREVATLLNQPEGTVKSRIRNGMRRMRAALTEAGVREVDA